MKIISKQKPATKPKCTVISLDEVTRQALEIAKSADPNATLSAKDIARFVEIIKHNHDATRAEFLKEAAPLLNRIYQRVSNNPDIPASTSNRGSKQRNAKKSSVRITLIK
jgi:hypothetical protein